MTKFTLMGRNMLKAFKFMLTAIGSLVLLLFIAGVVGAMWGDGKKFDSALRDAASTAVRNDARQAVFDVSAHELAQAYEENTVAADQRFKGKRFRVTGRVEEISTDLLGDPYVTLKGGVNEFMEPQFKFSRGDNSALARLRKGASVTLECTGSGDIAKAPMSDDCAIL